MAILRLIAFQKKNLTNIASSNESTKAPIRNISPNTRKDISELKAQFATPTVKPKKEPTPVVPQVPVEQKPSLDNQWFELLSKVKLKGFTKTLGFNSHLIAINNDHYEIQLNDDAKKVLELDPQSIAKLQAGIGEYLNKTTFRLEIKNIPSTISSSGQQSPAEIKQANAVQKITNDANVQLIKDTLEIDIQDKNITLIS